MICALCGERDAVLFIRRSRGDSSEDLALCAECAKGRGLSAGKGRLELRIEELLDPPAEAGAAPAAACPTCGLGVEELRREGRLGCASCASAFRAELGRSLRARRRPPFYRGRRDGPPAADAATSEAAAPLSPPADALEAAALSSRLAAALAAEDYELAASLRDGLAARGALLPLPGAAAFDLAGREGPEGDVVLWTEVRISRNWPDLVFPGRAAGPSPSRERARALFGGRPDWSLQPLAAAGDSGRRALVEAGYLSRAYAAEPEAFVALSGSLYCLFDEADHLRLRARLAGFHAAAALDEATRQARRLELAAEAAGLPFAFDEDFGYLASRLEECGLGAVLGACLHLPALAVSGLAERAFRPALAAGFALRGFYGAETGSAGDLYELSTERAYGLSEEELAAGFEMAVRGLVAAERRARAELLASRREELLDIAGRALGTLRYCRFLSAAEGAAQLSALRLGLLAGVVVGAEPADLAGLLGGLGPGGLALRSRGPAAAPGKPGSRGLSRLDSADRLRARLAGEAVAGLELKAGGE